MRLFIVDDPHRSPGANPDGAIAIEAAAALGYDLAGLIVNRDHNGTRLDVARQIVARHGSKAPVESGPAALHMARRVLSGAAPRSVRLLCTGAMTEPAWLTRQPQLWRAVEKVVIMASVTRTADGWETAACSNVDADPGSAAEFLASVQAAGTPTVVVDSTVCVWAGVPAHVWADAAISPDPWIRQTALTMHHQIARVWRGVRAGLLPPGRDTGWFLDGWCGGIRPAELPDDILPMVVSAPVYDALAMAAALTAEPLTAVETHPSCPHIQVLRPGAETDWQRAVAAQMRLINAALTPVCNREAERRRRNAEGLAKLDRIIAEEGLPY